MVVYIIIREYKCGCFYDYVKPPLLSAECHENVVKMLLTYTFQNVDIWPQKIDYVNR